MKKLIANICGYCGSDEKESLKTNFKTSMTKQAWKEVKEARDNGEVYFLKVCPACNTVVGVVIPK